MDKFTTLSGVAAPLLKSNVDTDTIIRIERLTQNARQDLGPYAFEALRFRPDGSEDPACVLNEPPFRDAPIVLAGENFGCGSSREGAVWALIAAGIRCVIAESFGDIFYNNCFQNGLLPIRLSASDIAALGQDVEVDLVKQTVHSGSLTFHFDIEPVRREALLDGLDEIARTMKSAADIARWEDNDRVQRPWIWST
ncbi:3-isopropylmalate dehydratase [Burkholderia sp. Leaf177]|uniref:3-isopropylmalate dehydratase small subunit n=1 Tax=Burkholderia sp. Leaf177 TaxID=1736287 RepID=UPI0006FC5EDE|nr:3-isopropylmalate dehydratase small subunit [Burkholderia sp. Leaf177]KQR81524.1 3-isopropylmalate dehydratase [Burkholderia sp. Leaf177]